MNATNENLYYQAILIQTEYTQEDIDLLYSVLSLEEKQRIDEYQKELRRDYRRGLADKTHKEHFEQVILKRIVRAIYTIIDTSARTLKIQTFTSKPDKRYA